MQIIQFDSSIPAQDIELTIGQTLFTGRLYYRERLQGWYIDLYFPDGSAFVLGRRLTPGYGPWLGLALEDAPSATWIVLGRAPYSQEDLGTESLEVLEVTADDVELVDDDDPRLTVEVD